jgi:polysaccharide export outer membrane protein
MSGLQRLLAAHALAALLLCGCESTPTPVATPGAPSAAIAPAPGMSPVDSAAALDPALLMPSADAFRLGPGDKLQIEVIGDANSSTSVTVGPDGKIYYYILPGIDVWGLTLSEARDRLEGGLQHFMREKPIVTVSLRATTSQRVWVLGQVNTPGVYTLARPTTLLEAVAEGGGLAAAAPGASPEGASRSVDLTHAFIIRHGKMLPVDFQRLLRDGDLSQNIYLQPDDFIFVPPARTNQIHVLGAVTRPQSQRMSGGLTVARAVAMAGGTAPDAYVSNVAILRGSLVRPQVEIVDLASIVHGRSADVRLEPGDIVYVPFTPYHNLTRYVNLILDTFARTVGVNAGAHAAGGEVATVGVSINANP